MTPLDAAEHEMEERGFICDAADARAIITAFLEAAAEDADTAFNVGEAALVNFPELGPRKSMGKAAILALKEAVNGA